MKPSVFLTGLTALSLPSLPFAVRAEEDRPETLTRIGFGSCASQEKHQRIWDAVRAAKPDIFLMAGDNIYGDTEDMGVLEAKYGKLAAKPGFAELRKTTPVLATWDDHDYGVNDGGASYPKKKESQKIMLDFFNVAADSPRRSREGVYGEVTYGPEGKRVQIILLDTRYFKSAQKGDKRTDEEKKEKNLVGWYVPDEDPAKTILGDAQWQWLEEQLKRPAELRLIVSSIQVIAGEKGMESWGCFPNERKKLYGLLAKTRAENVLFLSGDVHFSEVSRTNDGPYPLTDFTSSGLTNSHQGWADAVNPWRVSPIAFAEPTFGLLTIDWSAAPAPAVTLEAIGRDGKPGITHRLETAELRMKPGDAAK